MVSFAIVRGSPRSHERDPRVHGSEHRVEATPHPYGRAHHCTVSRGRWCRRRPELTARTQAAVGGQASGDIGNSPEWAVRIHTDNQLLDLLDEIVAGSRRGDRTRAEAAEFWAELLTREGHPLATRLPDENLVDWHTRGLLGDLAGARVLDIGCGNGRNGLSANHDSSASGNLVLTCECSARSSSKSLLAVAIRGETPSSRSRSVAAAIS